MSRVAVAAAVVAGLLAAAGCHGPQAPTPAATTASPTAGATPVVLSAAAPTASIPQPRLAGATRVRVNLIAISNPAGQGLVLGVAVRATDGRTADVGRVSPYPANQPGFFTLPLLEPAAPLVHDGSTVLVVTLAPALTGATLSPGLKLTVVATACACG